MYRQLAQAIRAQLCDDPAELPTGIGDPIFVSSRASRLLIRICLICIVLMLSGEIHAEPVSTDQDELVSTWISQLSSDRFAVRENATNRLIQAGPTVIGPLVEEITHAGLEVTTRGLTILRELALQDHVAAIEAEDAIRNLAQSRASSLAQRAGAVLKSLEGIRAERGIRILTSLGAKFSKAPSTQDVFISANLYVTFGKKWRGTERDLSFLQWLTEYERIHFTLRGEQVTDDWLGQLADYPPLVSLQINRANVSDAGMVHLRKMKKLELLSLRYIPLTNGSLTHLKAIAKEAPLRYVSVFGTLLTKSALDELSTQNESLQVRHRRGGFLGVSGNAAAEGAGCFISSVQPNQAAARAGLQQGDIIVKYGTNVVTEFSRREPSVKTGLPPTLSELIGADPSGTKVQLTILRGNQQLTKEVTLGEWP